MGAWRGSKLQEQLTGARLRGPAIVHCLYTPWTARVSSPKSIHKVGDARRVWHICVLMAWVYYSLEARIYNWILGIHAGFLCSLPPMRVTQSKRSPKELWYHQMQHVGHVSAQGSPVKTQHLGFFGRAGHVGILCLAHTRIPDSQESKCSA